MKTSIETPEGQVVEVVHGSLRCVYTPKHWEIIGDWLGDQDRFEVKVESAGRMIYVTMLPYHESKAIYSLLEHFTY